MARTQTSIDRALVVGQSSIGPTLQQMGWTVSTCADSREELLRQLKALPAGIVVFETSILSAERIRRVQELRQLGHTQGVLFIADSLTQDAQSGIDSVPGCRVTLKPIDSKKLETELDALVARAHSQKLSDPHPPTGEKE